ncbi:MAG: Zinc uptake system ATP-binding protein zurA [Candidatus Collierbacteria bacterium GW2011_GWB1_45_35]|uniref:Zinc uptake system ATP-binding protein zurA n=1 Tax=Candidatus Collierbacteria bacterium GW2011_GWB2_45_17 TaxID=1618388 RepID=A0A837IHE7_9BACT|nr:MAG: Zinc uptake system ATP-binding protein zurA [Microgenomates group bacterium GW2011_GWC1_44_23]KKT96090.1 MAG: Zinc uptake system ATP-binding protein zurA [Candidatus Collierbacteria bacterium GW2011_GWA1_45_15]KKU01036.1 MAG: Zinc uptake system ATP-binding protein zurA [Candidatus Collierbacteria bacterium GW2011_GWB2_45_17]KKU05646.1 MAG: Zinc uptake system ATP-binding protein zurA [Candidatus Collierbacteria bacterium GW2011_GWB1_45_35]KKU07929.1 MAG: Zinc uptake system ATP-binding pr
MSVDHTKNIIEVSGVSFAYNEDLVLENVDLNIHKGDYLGVIGPNGGGKTTLIKIMLGLLMPKIGVVKMFGEDIQSFEDWSKVGYVPQKVINFDVNFPATVFEVVAMGRYGKRGLFKSLTKEDKRIIGDSLKQVEMFEFKNRIIGDLSGGQQQRVFIARALAGQPEVIFLDEPMAGVDSLAQDQFYQLLKKLNHELGLTLVFISHDIEAVVNEVTEIAFVNRKLSYDDDPKSFVKEEMKKLYGDSKFIHHHKHV